MRLIGDTEALAGAMPAETRRPFVLWRQELQAGSWATEDELLTHYPAARRLEDGTHYFPLAADGSGVRVRLVFRCLTVRVLGLVSAPAPVKRPVTALSSIH